MPPKKIQTAKRTGGPPQHVQKDGGPTQSKRTRQRHPSPPVIERMFDVLAPQETTTELRRITRSATQANAGDGQRDLREQLQSKTRQKTIEQRGRADTTQSQITNTGHDLRQTLNQRAREQEETRQATNHRNQVTSDVNKQLQQVNETLSDLQKVIGQLHSDRRRSLPRHSRGRQRSRSPRRRRQNTSSIESSVDCQSTPIRRQSSSPPRRSPPKQSRGRRLSRSPHQHRHSRSQSRRPSQTRHPSVSHRELKEIPKFSGGNQDFDDWIESVQLQADLNRWSTTQAGDAARRRVDGEASRRLRQLGLQRGDVSLNQIKSEMGKYFFSEKDASLTAINNMKLEEKETVQSYGRRIEDAFLRLNFDVPQSHRVKSFCNGLTRLRFDIVNQVRVSAKTIAQAIDMVVDSQQGLDEHNKRSYNSRDEKRSHRDGRGFKPKESSTKSEKSNNKLHCDYHGWTSHTSADCRKLESLRKEKQDASSSKADTQDKGQGSKAAPKTGQWPKKKNFTKNQTNVRSAVVDVDASSSKESKNSNKD